jgi:hypothetical protein
MHHNKYSFGWILILALAAAGFAADTHPLSGAWKGTWAGGGSGNFDMNFTLTADGKLGGTVAVTSDMGNYNASFSSAVFSAGKLAAAYDYPPDPQGEITLNGNFDAKSGNGTWSLGAKGQPSQSIAAGTWKVAR